MSQHKLERQLGYSFQDKHILIRALTHASSSGEHLERQEFLGDAVLGLTISEYLYHQYPDLDEGDLSKMKANLVCKQALFAVSEQWRLEQHLCVGAGERHPDGRLKSESIAANAVESVIGAVFLDGGWDAAKAVVLKAWRELLSRLQPADLRDAKSKLQELTQAHGLGLPRYQISDLGAKASPRFEAHCFVCEQLVGKGYGERKKSAELDAAAQALLSKSLKAMMKA